MAVTERGMASITAEFAHPDADHSPAAYWFWHRLPTKAEIRHQIGDMLSGGFRSFQIQPRLAYPIDDYLGEDYLAACRTAVAEAAHLGMTVGIYDEYNWQSGQAGGRTVRGAPHLREAHVFWATARPGSDGIARCAIGPVSSSAQDLGPAGLAWQYDEGKVSWADWQVVAAVAYPRDGIRSTDQVTDVTGSARLTAALEAGCATEVRLDGRLTEGVVTVFVAARCATSRLPNYLLGESARRFIEVGYEPYFAAFGEYFGSTVRYFFFDQPHATFYDWPQRHGNLGSSLLYAPDLAGEFRRQACTGFDRGLLALVTDVGPDTTSLRCHFYQVYSELACRSYLGTLKAWCNEHHVALSGHEVLGHVGSWNPAKAFSSWDLRVNFGMDYFGVDSYRDITGVDAEDCVPQLSAKLGDSAARSSGRSGCIVEQYMAGRTTGGTPYTGHWGLTLSELRAQAIRLHLSGARQFLFHGYYQTDGRDGDPSLFTNPRFDFPPGINFEPWWPFHRAFADEMARLSTFLDQANPACDVAVLYPLRTCWAEGPRHDYAAHLEFWTSFLAEEGLGYHLIDERDLRSARTGDGYLGIGDRSYPCLVMPSVTTLQSADTMAVICDFTASGGLLLSSGQTPSRLQHGDDSAAAAGWAATRAGRAVRHFADMPAREEARAALAHLLRTRPHLRPASQTTSPLWQWTGHDGSAWRLAVFNDGPVPVSAVIAIPHGELEYQIWDAQNGEVTPWIQASHKGPGILSVRLAPQELRAMRLRTAPSSGHRDRPLAEPDEVGVPEPEPPCSQQPLADGWTLRIPGHAATPIRVDSGWEQQGYPSYSGVGYYTCTFDRPDARTWRLRLPRLSSAAEVRINGHLAGRRGWEPWEFDLPGLRDSGNKLEVAVYSTAANKYYDGTPFRNGPEPCGILAIPVLVSGSGA